MHIKAFLKKITENPLVESYHPRKSYSNNSKYTKMNNLSDGKSFCDKMLSSPIKNNESIVKYMQNHNPIIKARLIRSKQQNDQEPKFKKRFRERIEIRLGELISERKDLIVTRMRSRKQSTPSINFHSQKSPLANSLFKEMPEYVKNIMKPCKIASINIIQRPKSTQRTVQSEPKIYCKKLLPYKMSKSRISTIAIASERPSKLEAEIKVEAWHGGKLQQSVELWMT